LSILFPSMLTDKLLIAIIFVILHFSNPAFLWEMLHQVLSLSISSHGKAIEQGHVPVCAHPVRDFVHLQKRHSKYSDIGKIEAGVSIISLHNFFEEGGKIGRMKGIINLLS
jgi:hypothetical protein